MWTVLQKRRRGRTAKAFLYYLGMREFLLLNRNVLYNVTVFVFSRHALDKLKIKDSKLFNIRRKTIEHAIKSGLIVETEDDVVMVVETLDNRLSLCVVYKHRGVKIKIITFFVAKKGRYERKVLQRRWYFGNQIIQNSLQFCRERGEFCGTF